MRTSALWRTHGPHKGDSFEELLPVDHFDQAARGGVMRYLRVDTYMSTLSRTEMLKELVAGSFGSSVNSWISTDGLETAVVRVARGGGVRLDGIRNIYQRRALRNEERGSPIEGFGPLVQNMATSRAKLVLVHTIVDDRQREYKVFTDQEMTELMGILRFPVDRPKPVDLGDLIRERQ